MLLEHLLLSTAGVAGLMAMLWLVSLVKRDASVVDPWWSIGFLVVTIASGSDMPATPGRCLLATLVAIWALRLWAYLLKRNWGRPEDPRYAAFRQRFGAQRYWWVSLFQVFGLQGVLILVISSPLLVAMSKPAPDPITAVDLAGAALIVLGLTIEALADAQLAEFRGDPSRRGQVMDSGLWRYSRHPNYFGESVVWWGFWISSLDAPGGVFTMFSPLLMTTLLLRVSGVAMLEPSLLKSKPGYADYVARTSAFVLWPPRRANPEVKR
jgi:steroid 5-alpha reductase family enzyme